LIERASAALPPGIERILIRADSAAWSLPSGRQRALRSVICKVGSKTSIASRLSASIVSKDRSSSGGIGLVWCIAEHHADLRIQPVHEAHQPVDGEPVEIGVADAHELALVNPGSLPGLTRGQLPVVQNADDPGGEECLGLFHIGIGLAYIAKNVAAAAHDLEIIFCFGHLPFSFRAAFTHETARVTLLIGLMMTYLSSPVKAIQGCEDRGRPARRAASDHLPR
jgi:hypothetical protein